MKNSARILTGYRVDLWNTWKSYYDTASHWTGPVKVLGLRRRQRRRRRPGRHRGATSPTSPTTRGPPQRIARKLAVRFVSDDPSEALVDHLAAGLPRQRHRDQAGAPGTGRLRGVQGRGRGQGARRRPTTSSPPTGSSGPRSPRPVNDESAREHDPVADRRHRTDAVRLGPARRPARGQPLLVVGVTAPGLLRHPLRDGRAVVAQAGHVVPHAGRLVARRRPSGSTRWSSTCPSSSSASPRRRQLLQACCQATGRRGRRHHHARARAHEVDIPGPAHDPARHPRPPAPVTR